MRKKIGILLVAFALVCIGITLTTANRDRISESSAKKGNSKKAEEKPTETVSKPVARKRTNRKEKK